MKLVYLSADFYSRHCNDIEILKKSSRPYAYLNIQIENINYAIPLRHNINHKYAFFTVPPAGLDYTKAVPIMSSKDLETNNAQIEQATFNKLKGKEAEISRGLAKYISLYKNAMQYRDNPHYHFILMCSSLQYFEGIL